MTSKNCFSKMLVRDLKERCVWLISSIILFLLIYPVQILMSLDAIASYMKGEEEFQSVDCGVFVTTFVVVVHLNLYQLYKCLTKLQDIVL